MGRRRGAEEQGEMMVSIEEEGSVGGREGMKWRERSRFFRRLVPFYLLILFVWLSVGFG